jgi:SAM-dependent methyltransferase
MTSNSKPISSGSGAQAPLDKLVILKSYTDLVGEMQKFMLNQRVEEGAVEILEAGCGNTWAVRLDGLNYKLTGVDLDSEAINIRVNMRKDLDEAIVGDLRNVDLGSRKFDIVYNSFVLEHIQGAENVLKRFVGWLKPNGIIVLEIPDPDSVHGLVTRITPHWFHVLYYRYVLGYKTAGKRGYAPYPTFYDSVVSRAGIRAFARQNGLTIEAEYGAEPEHGRARVVDRVISMFKRLVNVLSFGKYSDRHSNLLYVLRLRT